MWIKNIISSILPWTNSQTMGQGAQAFEEKAKAKLIGVTDGVYLSEEARKKSMEYYALARKTGTPLERPPLWSEVRKKVKKNVANFYDIEEVMDEITERIVEAAQHDPFYKKLFR